MPAHFSQSSQLSRIGAQTPTVASRIPRGRDQRFLQHLAPPTSRLSRAATTGRISKMPSTGAGPSRRSHTKSRKGCKTCKRRHIRCDETFPQCRNCTKHQCRCDYMDGPAPAEDSTTQSPVPGLFWTPEIEQIVQGWERTGEARLGSFSIDLHAEGHRYSRADLHLIYFVLFSGQSPETREYTVWTSTTAQTLAAARSKPFLVHAILAFSALSLAWESNNSEVKSIAYHHGGIALEGLQQAIASFSRENSDAVLLASVLLSWQANDWRSWVSLTSGIRTVVNSMQPFKLESAVGHVVDEQEAAIPESFPSMSRAPVDDEFHNNYVMSLQQMIAALDTLEPYHSGPKEVDSFKQLSDYLKQLQAARPADTPQEQFNHLYHFRKFLFWIPSTSLKSNSRSYSTLLGLSYLYCIALQMEPLFPNVAAAFCSRMVLQPLNEIFNAFDNLHRTSMPGDEQVQNMLALLQYPRQIVDTYHAARQMRDAALEGMRRTPPGFDSFSGDLAYSIEVQNGGMPQRSPAFGPPIARSSSVHSMTSSQQSSPYLELPETMPAAQLPTMTAIDTSPPIQHDVRYGSAPVQTDSRFSVQPDVRYGSAAPSSGALNLSIPSMPTLEVEAPTPIDPQVPPPFGVNALGLNMAGNNRLSMDEAGFAMPQTTSAAYTHARGGSEGTMANPHYFEAPLGIAPLLPSQQQPILPTPSHAAEERIRAAQGI